MRVFFFTLVMSVLLLSPMGLEAIGQIHYTNFSTLGQLTSDQIETLGVNDGLLGIAGKGWVSLLEISDEIYHRFPLPENEGRLRVNAVFPITASSFWLGTNNGLYLYDGHYRRFDKRDGMPHVDVRNIRKLSSGKIFMGLFAGSIAELGPDGPGTFIQTAPNREIGEVKLTLGGISALSVQDITEFDGEKYLALSSRGLGILGSNGVFRDFDQKDKFTSSWVTSVAANDEFVYVGTTKGLYKIQGSVADKIALSLDSEWVTSVDSGRDGSIWVGTRKGLVRLSSDGAVEKEYSLKSGNISDENITRVSFDKRTQSLFVATKTSGIYRFLRNVIPPVQTLLDKERYIKNEMVLSFKEGATNEEIQLFLQQNGLSEKDRDKNLNAILIDTGSRDSLEMSKEVATLDVVSRAEPNFRYYHLSTYPSDPFYRLQGNLNTIAGPKAWDKYKGNSSIVLAILDTGVDTSHQDLDGRLIGGANYVGGGKMIDDHGHGTHVAGIAMAESSNGQGVTGIDWKGRIMPVRVLGRSGGSSFSVARGIFFAAYRGADVINMSLGSPARSWWVSYACKWAQKRGTVIVAAMGNDNTDQPFYPAAYPGVVAVGASDNSGRRAPFSNRGSWLALYAPGVRIASTYIGQYKYAYLSGTSMASPHVAGAVALFLGLQKDRGYKKSSQTPAQVLDALKKSAKKSRYGLPMLNLENLLKNVQLK